MFVRRVSKHIIRKETDAKLFLNVKRLRIQYVALTNRNKCMRRKVSAESTILRARLKNHTRSISNISIIYDWK